MNIFCFKLDRWKHMKQVPLVNDVVNSIGDLVASFVDHILQVDEKNHEQQNKSQIEMAQNQQKAAKKAEMKKQQDEIENQKIIEQNQLKAQQEAANKLAMEKLEAEKLAAEKLAEAEAKAAEIAAQELANQVPDNYKDAFAFFMDKLLSKPWAVYMETDVGSHHDADLPQEQESTIKDNFANIQNSRDNIFGAASNQTFFKSFLIKVDKCLMLDNKEEELNYDDVKKLFKLLIGSFKIEARFLYQELEVMIGKGDAELFDGQNMLKSGLPYSKTALSYYLTAKNKNNLNLD